MKAKSAMNSRRPIQSPGRRDSYSIAGTAFRARTKLGRVLIIGLSE
jgi:hypothetical protein